MTAQRPTPQLHATSDGKLGPDVVARPLARGALGDEMGARLVHERLHLRLGHGEDTGDLALGEVAELEEDERGALLLGEPIEVADECAQVLAAPHGVGEPVEGGTALELVDRDLAVAPRREQRVAAVAGDGVQPRPQVVRRVARRRWRGARA